jgi:predicted glycosyltransferase
MALRIMAYGHDSVGLGHFNRMLAICERIRAVFADVEVLMATGTPYVPVFDLPEGVDYVKLPALAKPGAELYCGKYLKGSAERVLACRRDLLLSAVRSFEPDLLLVDKAPAGVCGEMRPALDWLQRNRPATRRIFGMRDIEDDPGLTISQWTANGAFEALERYYDEIWVYGMRNVFDVEAEYRLSESNRRKLSFMGYVVRDPCHHAPEPGDDEAPVLVTVGGGTDGHRVLSTYLEDAAAAVARRGRRSIIIGGPDLPRPQAQELAETVQRTPGAVWMDYVRCLGCCIRQASVIVSMGGYNTLCEIVSRCKPAVVIPRTSPRREQAIRADRWSRRAHIDVLPPDELTPQVLTGRVLATIDRTTGCPDSRLDFHGLDRVQHRLGTLFGMETGHAAAVRV